ncbi:hypothetical protein DPMN_183199 [Dreissena polymorpha]|uniref:Transmembrane 9 superfamily member n=1 Tax=Dreissena polymorpha TaxID=45954 RepID=A0A9D4I5C3_DREPO|nr:hypothetical protein DPMN_183199 [Dreissena polymorpha]
MMAEQLSFKYVVEECLSEDPKEAGSDDEEANLDGDEINKRFCGNRILKAFANSLDPDETPQNVAKAVFGETRAIVIASSSSDVRRLPSATRVLKSDFARYNVEDEDSEELDQDDNGWKIIHTDVFRFPANKNLFCAILGVGMQFLTLATGIMLMAMLGLFNVHHHGQINSAGIILYAFTSCISGYVATNMYKKMGGEKWVWNINLTSALFAAPFFLVWALINSVAWAYGTTQALPVGTIILLMCLWMFVGYPLTVIGGIFGKNGANGFDAPCRTKNIAREIPAVPWYRSGFAHCLVGGFLPFSSISVELYYIFATLWGREQYTLYGILLIVFGILLSVTACISVALTYFQLSSEDYRWWWRSMFSAGSTGLFVFLYALFYYYKRSNMSGLLQTLEFFGYTILTCYVFFLMLGTVSFFASLSFVRYIYVNLKMD